jgi:hypothetical protein
MPENNEKKKRLKNPCDADLLYTGTDIDELAPANALTSTSS